MSRDGNLRASDADRELAVSMLQAAAAEGRLDHDELAERVQRALRARTYAELADTVVDLPVSGQRRDRRRGDPGPAWATRSAGSRSRAVAVSRRTARTVRHNPSLLIVAVPVMALAASFALMFAMVWLMIVAVAMLVGGRTRAVVAGRSETWRVSWASPRPLGPRRHG